jgi:hypothetical protein
MPYKRVNSRSIKFLGNATDKIIISQGTDRTKLNFGQDGDTEFFSNMGIRGDLL